MAFTTTNAPLYISTWRFSSSNSVFVAFEILLERLSKPESIVNWHHHPYIETRHRSNYKASVNGSIVHQVCSSTILCQSWALLAEIENHVNNPANVRKNHPILIWKAVFFCFVGASGTLPATNTPASNAISALIIEALLTER
jgi:hypothetical protein